MKILLTILTMLVLVSGVSVASAAKLLNSTDSDTSDIIDVPCPKHGIAADADFCGKVVDDNGKKNDEDVPMYWSNGENDKGVYACNMAKDTDKFCKENLDRNYKRQQDQFHHTPGIGKITVGYGDVGSYYGKGKVVIKNLDTGKTLVTHKLNFAKQHHNQGPDCCEKVYTFDKSGTHYGDRISANVTAGDGRWESGTYNYKNNLRMSITLDEIGK